MSITVYVKNGCVQCDMTKRTLDNANIDYDTVNLDENPEALTRVKQLGFLSAPVVITDTDAWAGFQPEKLATIQPHTEQLKNGDIKMQNPAEIEFRTGIWSKMSARLEDESLLIIQMRLEDGEFVQTQCELRSKPNGKKVEDVFPPEYQFGGEKQHPAYSKLIHPLLLTEKAKQLRSYMDADLPQHNLNEKDANRFVHQLRGAGSDRQAQIDAIAHLVDVELDHRMSISFSLRDELYIKDADKYELKNELFNLVYGDNGLKIKTDMELVEAIHEVRQRKLAGQIPTNAQQQQFQQQVADKKPPLETAETPHQTFTVVVTIETDTLEHAKEVVTERIGYDEDLGFDYRIGWRDLQPSQVTSHSTHDMSVTRDATHDIDSQQSLSAAGRDHEKTQAEYAAPQYQQQQFQQQQQAPGAQMNL